MSVLTRCMESRSLNRTNSKSTGASKAPPHSKTLARWLRGPKIRQVLECAAAAALSISHEVMVRNACGGNPVHFSFAQD